MKKLIQEFRAFISKGNVIDLAVGVIIGTTFSAIVSSLVNDVLSPAIGLIADTDLSDLVWRLGGVEIRYGAFFTAVIDFFIMALVLFLMVKLINRARSFGERAKQRLGGEAAEAPAPPAVKTCPYCKKEIAIDASRCAYCTSVLETEPDTQEA